MRFVEVNFEKDNLELKLKEAGFDEKVPAVVLWEGVVSYLSEPAVNANLLALSRLLAPHSRLILTYVHKGALDGSVTFRSSRRWAVMGQAQRRALHLRLRSGYTGEHTQSVWLPARKRPIHR